MVKEGAIMVCVICKKELPGDEYWTVTRLLKEIPHSMCPKCGKEITVEYIPYKDAYQIKKTCNCDIIFSSHCFEREPAKWKKKVYIFCPDCAKTIFGSTVVYAEIEGDSDG